MYLTNDNKCSIYETRPLVCNVEEGYKVFFADKMSKEEYNKMNRVICISLQQGK
jgi:Fe-S-cluster containining protein